MGDKIKSLIQRLKGNEFWLKLAKNVSTIVVGQGGASALNMVTAFASAGILGAAGYGSLMIGQTFMQAVDAFLNFQSWQGVIRYGSICMERHDDDGLAATIKAGFFVDVCSAIVGCAVSFAIVPYVSSLLGWDAVSTTAATIFCFEIIVHIEGTPTGVLRLFDKFNYVAIYAVSIAAMKLALVASTLYLYGPNVVAVACVYCAVDVIKGVALFVLALAVVSKRIGLKKVVAAKQYDLPSGFLSFTLWSNLAGTADAPIQYFDVFFLSMLSSEVVGVFKFFKQLLTAFTLLSTPVQQAIMPQLAELIAKGKNEQAYSVVKRIERIFIKVVTPFAILAIIVVPPALGYFMDPLYGRYWYLFAALTTLTEVGIVFTALHPCFTAYGLSKQSTGITLLANVTYLLACYFLLSVMGVMAIPLAMCMQYALAICLKTIYIKRVVLS